jgi:histidine ammonia-lyase
MAAHGARRLMHMAKNTSAVIGIELLASVQGCDFHHGLKSSQCLENVRKLVRFRIATLDNDRYMHPDIEEANRLVRDGTVVEALGQIRLPGIEAS